jgi:hypothetical protein
MSIITVKSKGERFRRAGIEFSRAGIELDTAELTQDQVDAIQAEPNLVIVGDAELVGGKKPAKNKKSAKDA